MPLVDLNRTAREVALIQRELLGAALVQPDLFARVAPYLHDVMIDADRFEELKRHILSADADWNPERFVAHGIARLERIFGS